MKYHRGCADPIFIEMFRYFKNHRVTLYLAIYVQKNQNTCKISVWGGDCHNYALLAGGHIDIVIENNLSWHDIAALVTVIEEAGGYISNWRGKNLDSNCDGSIIASCSEDIHHQIIDLINN